MSLRIGGMGWVTPLGSGVETVWERLLNGDVAMAETIESSLNARSYQVYRVPSEAIATAPAHPRLRRSSSISRFAVVAGLAALEDAQLKLDPATAERTAVIFAISNGGVIYTKRFYHEVVESGAQAASPLLFPETVFNAPASHLAAILGITGASYTLVGDGAVGVLALKMAEDLMENPAIDRCLVVGAEEADWLLCEAYHQWHLLRAAAPPEPFHPSHRGMILSEGAGAVLLDRSGGGIAVEQIDAGCNFRTQREAASCVAKTFGVLEAADEDIVVASANGTFIDGAEASAIGRYCAGARVYSPKAALGESVGASTFWQVTCAAQALRTGQLPPMPAPEQPAVRLSRDRVRDVQPRRAIVSACGMNQQVAGLALRLAT
jgi:3-oxoacyl-(acyl-carrier-protein) synthase